jgi:hypothetical protein
VVLYAITIDPHQAISMSLSPASIKAAEEAVARILAELEAENTPSRAPALETSGSQF